MTVRDIIKRALRLLRVIAAGEDPTTDEVNDALSVFNSAYRSLFGHGIGQPLTVDYCATAGDTAKVGGLYSVAVYTPQYPKDGERFGVNAAVTVTATNGTIEGVASVAASAGSVWYYRQDLADWVREADYRLSDEGPLPASMHEHLAHLIAPRMAGEFGAELTPSVIDGIEKAEQMLAQRYGFKGSLVLDPGIVTQRQYFNFETGV